MSSKKVSVFEYHRLDHVGSQHNKNQFKKDKGICFPPSLWVEGFDPILSGRGWEGLLSRHESRRNVEVNNGIERTKTASQAEKKWNNSMTHAAIKRLLPSSMEGSRLNEIWVHFIIWSHILLHYPSNSTPQTTLNPKIDPFVIRCLKIVWQWKKDKKKKWLRRWLCSVSSNKTTCNKSMLTCSLHS